jgi:hypothetical protein
LGFGKVSLFGSYGLRGQFSFGGHLRGISKIMYSYIKALEFYEQYNEPDFFLIANRAANKSVNISMHLNIIKTLCLQSNSQSHRLFDDEKHFCVGVANDFEKHFRITY